MPSYKVNVKWGKEKFANVECNTEEPPVVFKAQLFALSGVQPDRQKVMMKGAVIKDDEWGSVKLKDGATLLMMGSAGELPEAPAERPVFMEDMSEQELASALSLPAGLTNLGNTCYMNSVVQCLRAVPELSESLKKYQGGLMMEGGSLEPAGSITAALRDLYKTMESTSTSISPIIFLQVMHMAFPRFAEKSEHGGYQQQDANECWTEVMRSLQQKLPALAAPEGQATPAGAVASKGFIDQYFGGEYETVMKNTEAADEEATKGTEAFLQLSCFIEKEVKYMQTGLKGRLEETITKNSPTLGRDALYTKSSKIKRLPAYLAVQFVRFYFKEKEAINAKILKDVKFSMTLDVYDLCSEELQTKLTPMRDRFKAEEDRIAEALVKAKVGDVKEEEEKKVEKKALPYWLDNDIGSNNSGFYELSAVLTHKGRSSSSGHYVSWVRKKGDDWVMFDDDKVSSVTSEDILKLSGGGDWHCAYVLLYSPRILEVDANTMES